MYQHITAYCFTRLQHLPVLQADMFAALQDQRVLGTVLLADEGINLSLAGDQNAITAARHWLLQQPPFSELRFKQTASERQPFSKLKVRIRREIITFDDGATNPANAPAPSISPATLDAWLDAGKPFVLLDTRNDYEVEIGTFTQATTLPLAHFREFPAAIQNAVELDRNMPVVTFCTGGVRCEKAAPWMLQNGFDEVYQLDGGILAYLQSKLPAAQQAGTMAPVDSNDTASGGESSSEAEGDPPGKPVGVTPERVNHWRGDCFVFDDRVAVDASLDETGASICRVCQRVIYDSDNDNDATDASRTTQHQRRESEAPRAIHITCSSCRDAQRDAIATV